MRRTIPPSSADGLAQRLRRMEQEIADLQSVRNPPPEYVEPEAAGGGGGEAFRAKLTGPTSRTFAAGAGGDLTWSWSTGFGQFYTDNISLDGGDEFTLVDGLWIFTIEFAVYPDGSPTSGTFQSSIGSFTDGVARPFDALEPYISYAQILYMSSPGGSINGPTSPFVVNFYNGYNVPVFVEGFFAGAQLPASAVTATT